MAGEWKRSRYSCRTARVCTVPHAVVATHVTRSCADHVLPMAVACRMDAYAVKKFPGRWGRCIVADLTVECHTAGQHAGQLVGGAGAAPRAAAPLAYCRPTQELLADRLLQPAGNRLLPHDLVSSVPLPEMARIPR